MSARSHTFEFVVLGGGPAGAICALQLARAGAEVGLLHCRSTAPSAVELVSGRARSMMRPYIGDVSCLHGAVEIDETISLWNSSTPARWNALLDPWGPGIAVSRTYFDEYVRATARQANAAVHTFEKPLDIGRQDGNWLLFALQDQTCAIEIRAKFLVLATGRVGRPVLGRTNSSSFPQLALTSRLHIQSHRVDNSLYIEAADDGWWYAIPDASAGYFIGFCTQPQRLKHRQVPLNDFFWRRLFRTQLIATILPGVTHCTTIAGRSAGVITFDQIAGDGWIAVGDAAFASDPLSGMGIEFGVESAERAANVLLSGNVRNHTEYISWVTSHVLRQTEAGEFHRPRSSRIV
jgi:flavin-dependent dehydrogenase